MADEAITLTETNPTYTEGHGGGRGESTLTEETPTYEIGGDLIPPGGMVGLPPGLQLLLD